MIQNVSGLSVIMTPEVMMTKVDEHYSISGSILWHYD